LTPNDVLKSLRYTFDFGDSKMIAIFALVGHEVDRTLVCQWLKKEEDPDYVSCKDMEFSCFLNGLIIDKRGKKEGPQPEPEKKMTNNIVLRKLKIALDFKAEDVVEVLSLADFSLSKHELSALFRKPDHKNYRACKDQVLRNFLQGLRIKFRPEA